MIYSFSLILVILFSIFGIVNLIGDIIIKLNDNKETFVLVANLGKDDYNSELTLRNTILKMKWYGKRHISKIIFIDKGMSQETRKLCDELCDKYDFMEIRESSKLDDFV